MTLPFHEVENVLSRLDTIKSRGERAYLAVWLEDHSYEITLYLHYLEQEGHYKKAAKYKNRITTFDTETHGLFFDRQIAHLRSFRFSNKNQHSFSLITESYGFPIFGAIISVITTALIIWIAIVAHGALSRIGKDKIKSIENPLEVHLPEIPSNDP